MLLELRGSLGLGRELEEYQVREYLSGVLLTLNQGDGEPLAESSFLHL